MKPTAEALRAHGSRPALTGCAPDVSYRALAGRATAVSDALDAMGVAPGERVALLSAGRHHDEAVALVGTLMHGSIAVPIDASAPEKRRHALLADCRALIHDDAAAATARRHAGIGRIDLDEEGHILASVGDARAVALAPDENVAMVLHTSGSTGVPKPVAIRWEGVQAFVEWMTTLTAVAPDRRVLRVAELCFDLAIFDHLATFEAGATLCTLARRDLGGASTLGRVVSKLAPQVIYAVPAMFTMLLETSPFPPSIDTCCFAGEVFPPLALRRLADAAPHARLFNLFGPTETNVCTYWEVDRSRLDGASEIPIGAACPYAACKLVDEAGHVLLGPAIGELIVTGPTAMGGEVATGDRVERMADGTLYFRGRLDRMLKIAGRRVDPHEVEAALVDHPAVREAAVIGREQARIGLRLRAYVATSAPCDPSTLRKHVASRLPPYMVPDDVVLLDALPRTATGKVDYRALV